MVVNLYLYVKHIKLIKKYKYNKSLFIPMQYKKLLNKKDPLDKEIIRLVKKGDLKIGITKVK